jgi:hypothetical protein
MNSDNIETLARAVIKDPHDVISYGSLCDLAGVKEGRRMISADERFIHAAAFLADLDNQKMIS